MGQKLGHVGLVKKKSFYFFYFLFFFWAGGKLGSFSGLVCPPSSCSVPLLSWVVGLRTEATGATGAGLPLIRIPFGLRPFLKQRYAVGIGQDYTFFFGPPLLQSLADAALRVRSASYKDAHHMAN